MDQYLVRMQTALDRLESALRSRSETGSAHAAADRAQAALAAENARLRAAVDGAISQIDSLMQEIGQPGAPRPEEAAR